MPPVITLTGLVERLSTNFIGEDCGKISTKKIAYIIYVIVKSKVIITCFQLLIVNCGQPASFGHSSFSRRDLARKSIFDAFRIEFLPGARRITGLRHARASAAYAPSGAAKDARDDFRRVIHHRHDARVIQPRRADDAEGADDPPLAVAQGRRDQRRTR